MPRLVGIQGLVSPVPIGGADVTALIAAVEVLLTAEEQLAIIARALTAAGATSEHLEALLPQPVR